MGIISTLKRIFTRGVSGRKVVTRIAPSPTGKFHFGTARSALFNFLIAKKYGGTFIVRIEDTDKERSTKENEKDILSGLEWLGITGDATYRQSERGDIYTTYLKRLVDEGSAYISKEKKKDREGNESDEMVEVVRLKNPGTDVTFTDRIRGDITFNTEELGDFVIARSVTEPLYHLAVVVDDYEMGVTHVIRGEDHISNTPRQILIQRALSIAQPEYAHIPLILAPDRSKMSKRKGHTGLTEYRENGYLPEALVNYLAFLGWNPGTDKEVYTLKELIHDFSLNEVQKGGAVFDIQKLNWFNREHLRMLPKEKLLTLVTEALPERVTTLPQYSLERLTHALGVITERISTLHELTDISEKGEFDYLFTHPTLETELTWKKDEPATTLNHLAKVIELLTPLSEHEFTQGVVKEIVWEYASEKGRGSVLWPMRVALSGKEKSPDPFEIAEIIGKEDTLHRLSAAHASLEKHGTSK